MAAFTSAGPHTYTGAGSTVAITDLPFGTLARLAQNEERRCAGGEAGGRDNGDAIAAADYIAYVVQAIISMITPRADPTTRPQHQTSEQTSVFSSCMPMPIALAPVLAE